LQKKICRAFPGNGRSEIFRSLG